MRFLNNLTIKNLKINKKRTISLIIGIILAIFLITSVITIISSFQKTLLEHTKKTKGDYHYGFLNVPAFELDEFSKDENIDKIFVTKILGYSSLQESSGTNIPLEILSFSQGSLDNLGLEIIDGRIPQTDSEIIFSDTLTKYNETDIKLGSQIELELQNGDNSYKKTYTIVGMVNITDEYIETVNNLNSDKYIAITKLNEYSESDKLNVYIKIKDLDKRLETIAKLQGIGDNTYKNLIGSNNAITEKNLSRYENNKYVYLYNNTLLGMQTGDYIDETAKMVYSVAGIIILVIILTSVYCIRNSFDISITEKIKQYGILSSIGATKKQIRKIVFHEAFILGIISIPIGIIIGILFVYIFLKILGLQLGKSLFGMEFIFSTNLYAIIITIILSSLILYLSARKSAKKASKLSPLEAIKGSRNLQINSKKLKTPKIIKKLFGIGGVLAYKNIKRNKKRYRTTIVSLILSVTLLITAISFSKYTSEVVKVYVNQENYDIFVNSDDFEKLKKITEDAKINRNRYQLYRSLSVEINDAEEHYTDNFKKLKTGYTFCSLVSLGKQEYERYIKSLGLNYETAKDKIILMDITTESIEENGKFTYQQIDCFNYVEGDKISIKIDFNKDSIETEIIKITSEKPLFLATGASAFLIVSDEFMDKYYIQENQPCFLHIQVEDDIELEKYIKENYSDSYWAMGNNAESRREQQSIITGVLIFLYGSIIITALIGTTNIFNTITTSMELRQREFMHLKSIGMTKKEFNKMIRLETIFLGGKSLIIGIILGLILSYLIYLGFSLNVELNYNFPIEAIIISIIAVSILIGGIMKYSLNKINKLNIIETIRNENI